MYPSSGFQKNLRIPETGANFSLNIFLNKLNLINILDPTEYDDSCNKQLLKKYDACEETRGKVSFIPLDFLQTFLLSKNYIKEPFQAENKIELKKKYISFFNEMNLFDNNFFLNNKYKNIPIVFFRKEYLSASLSKSIDAALIEEETDENEFNFLNLTKILYKSYKLCNIDKSDQNEWLHKNDLIKLISIKILSLKESVKNDVCFLPFLYLKNPLYNIDYTYSDILNSFDFKSFETSKRYIIFIILYKSHFTAVIIDKEVETNNGKKKVAMFFNSCGYNPNNFNYNKNYWFIDNSSKIHNFKSLNTKYDNNNNYYMPIESLCLILKDKLNITNFIFNTFCIQNFGSECGMFSSMFLFFFLEMINNKKNIDTLSYKYLYFNMLNLGFDLTYGMLRGLLFFTTEDVDLNGITVNLYNNSPYIYSIKNKKFKEYIKIYYKNLLNFEKIHQKINIQFETFLNKYKTILK